MPTTTVLEARYVSRSKLDEVLRRNFGHDYSVRVYDIDAGALGLLVIANAPFRFTGTKSR